MEADLKKVRKWVKQADMMDTVKDQLRLSVVDKVNEFRATKSRRLKSSTNSSKNWELCLNESKLPGIRKNRSGWWASPRQTRDHSVLQQRHGEQG